MSDDKRIVRLVKTDGVIGSLPVGELYEVPVRPDISERDAVIRAYAMLKREHPTENQMCWSPES